MALLLVSRLYSSHPLYSFANQIHFLNSSSASPTEHFFVVLQARDSTTAEYQENCRRLFQLIGRQQQTACFSVTPNVASFVHPASAAAFTVRVSALIPFFEVASRKRPDLRARYPSAPTKGLKAIQMSVFWLTYWTPSTTIYIHMYILESRFDASPMSIKLSGWYFHQHSMQLEAFECTMQAEIFPRAV